MCGSTSDRDGVLGPELAKENEGMKYECFIKPGCAWKEIEAENAEEARRKFLEELCDNLGTEDIIANNLDTEDGEDES
jgi:hypothetical protein